jgi:hypothetical protein
MRVELYDETDFDGGASSNVRPHPIWSEVTGTRWPRDAVIVQCQIMLEGANCGADCQDPSDQGQCAKHASFLRSHLKMRG